MNKFNAGILSCMSSFLIAYSGVISAQTVPVSITTTFLANATVGISYTQNLTATGGVPPYSWKVASGSLPVGLSLTSKGAIAGSAAEATLPLFTLQVTDSSATPQTGAKVLSLNVVGPVSGIGTPVVDCGILSRTGGVYVLQNDVVSAGTCFSIQADNVVLDLNGHKVTYAASDNSVHRYGVLGIACWDHDLGTGNPCGGRQNNLTVMNGTIAQGAAAAPYSHAIRMGQSNGIQGLTVHNVDMTVNAASSIAISTTYSNGGASIYNNVIHNNVTEILNRLQLEGASIKLANENLGILPNSVHDNIIIGGAQGGIFESNPSGSKIFNNDISTNANYTNGFCVFANGANSEIYGNYIHPVQGRGIHVASANVSVHDNTISVLVKANNLEYGTTIVSMARVNGVVTLNTKAGHGQSTGNTVVIAGAGDPSFNGSFLVTSGTYYGTSLSYNQSGPDAVSAGGDASACQIEGAYGIRIKADLGSPDNVQIFNNIITAHAGECNAEGIRFSDLVGHGKNIIIRNNQIVAVRDVLPLGGVSTRQARGLSANDDTDLSTIAISDNVVTADTSGFQIGYDGGTNGVFTRNTFIAGPNSSGWVMAEFTNGGGPPSNGHVFRDTTFGPGTSASSSFGPYTLDGNYSVAWMLSLTIQDQAGRTANGAIVTITDARGNTVFSGVTDTRGSVSPTITQMTTHKISGSIVSDVFTPHTVRISQPGCAATAFAVSMTGVTPPMVRTISCP